MLKHSRVAAAPRLVAAEHIVWAPANGFTPQEIATAVGCSARGLGWREVVTLLASHWRRLTRRTPDDHR